jgi:hypothetical protein
MTSARALDLVWSGLLATALAGCLGDDDAKAPPPVDAGRDGTVALDAAPASPAPDASTDAGPSVLELRFANWAPDAPAIDVCLAPHGSSMLDGPLLAARAPADAGPAALAFPEVSAYLAYPRGAYDVRVVPAGSDCAVGIVVDTALAAPGSPYVTVALVGEAHAGPSAPGLEVLTFADDARASGVALRVIHAAPEVGLLDVGADGVNGGFAPWFRGLAFGGVAPSVDAGTADGGVTIDSNGYVSLKSMSAVTLGARAEGALQDLGTAPGVTAAAGSVLTIAVLGGDPPSDGGAAGIQWLECVDNAGTLGVTGSCGRAGAQASKRQGQGTGATQTPSWPPGWSLHE